MNCAFRENMIESERQMIHLPFLIAFLYGGAIIYVEVLCMLVFMRCTDCTLMKYVCICYKSRCKEKV